MNKEIDSGMNIYDFNRVNMGQLPYLETKEEIDSVKTFLKNYINSTYGNYYMMLNHDRKDFTLFNFLNGVFTDIKITTMVDDIIECMENRGLGFLDVELDNAETAVEIWVKDRNTEAVFMYLLFPYDNGVIEY